MANPPKPTSLLKASGNYRKDRHGDRVEARPGRPSMPPWVRSSVAEWWDNWCDQLTELGVLSEVDQLSLGLLANAFALYLDALNAVEVDGLTCRSEKGALYQSPAVGILNQAWDRVEKMCQRFGLSPAARASIKATPRTGPESAEDRFFNNGRKPRLVVGA